MVDGVDGNPRASGPDGASSAGDSVQFPTAARWMGLAVLLATGAVLFPSAPGQARAPVSAGRPVVIAATRGGLAGIGQDRGAVFWCRRNSPLHATSFATRTDRTLRIACPSVSSDIALARGRVAVAGYDDLASMNVRVVVDALVSGHQRRVATIYAPDLYRDLVSDGTGLFYGVDRVSVEELKMTDNGSTYRATLVGGGVYRIIGSRAVRVAALHAPAALAAGNGMIAFATPQRRWVYQGNASDDFVRGGAWNGAVEIHRSKDASLVARFRPRGSVYDLALSREHAVVAAALRGERGYVAWYDSRTGTREGEILVADVSSLTTSGHLAVFHTTAHPSGTETVWLLDLRTGKRRPLDQSKNHSFITEPSVRGSRVAWGETTYGCISGPAKCSSRILTLSVAN